MKLFELNEKLKQPKVGDIVRYWWSEHWIYIKVVKIKDGKIAGWGCGSLEECKRLNSRTIAQWRKLNEVELYEVIRTK
jgi:hypothetical protein